MCALEICWQKYRHQIMLSSGYLKSKNFVQRGEFQSTGLTGCPNSLRSHSTGLTGCPDQNYRTGLLLRIPYIVYWVPRAVHFIPYTCIVYHMPYQVYWYVYRILCTKCRVPYAVYRVCIKYTVWYEVYRCVNRILCTKCREPYTVYRYIYGMPSALQ